MAFLFRFAVNENFNNRGVKNMTKWCLSAAVFLVYGVGGMACELCSIADHSKL